jgi:hypothetical protein
MLDCCGGHILIGDKITLNSKEYVVKKDITFGEYRKFSNLNTKLTNIQSQFDEKLDDVEIAKITSEFAQTTNEQMQLMVEFLESTLGLKQKDLDSMSLEEAVVLFQESFKACTEVKKKSDKTSASPYN